MQTGVAHNPASVSSVRGINAASWNNKRPCGVTLSLQVRKHIVEAHADVPSNVFSNDPSGPEFSHDPTKFWPEVAVILLAFSLPGCGKGLAWVSSANNVNCADLLPCEFSNIMVNRHLRPVFAQNLARGFFDFAEGDGLEAACALQAKAESAYAAKQVKDL
jgi:hypothetical protein